MQSGPHLHEGKKDDWSLLHLDQDLDRWVGDLAEQRQPYPEPVLHDL